MTAPETVPAIELRGLEKSFGSNHVLRGVDLAVDRSQAATCLRRDPIAIGSSETSEHFQCFSQRFKP